MASIQLLILIWISLTQTIPSLEASPCTCNGLISNEGKGECVTRHTGKLWCYVNPQTVCSDKKESKSISGKSWSFQACQENIAGVSGNDDDQQKIISEDCICNGFISSEGKGECGTKYNGKFWCYINSQAGCNDKKESKSISGKSWSFQACQVKDNIASVPGNDDAQLTALDVDDNGNVRCEDESDCPNYDQNTMRNILGLTEEWNPYMSCMIPDQNEGDTKNKICILQYGTTPASGLDFDDLCSVCKPLRFSTSTTGQGTLSSPWSRCRRGYCKRGSRCCNLVWAGGYRGYICPWRC